MIGNDDSGDKESYWLIDGDSDAVMLLLMVIVLLMVMLMVVMAMTMMRMRIRITILRWRGGWGCGRMMIDEHSRKMKKAILATVAPFASTCHMRQIHIDPVIQIGKTIGPIAKIPHAFFVTKKWINSSDPQFFLGKIVHIFLCWTLHLTSLSVSCCRLRRPRLFEACRRSFGTNSWLKS